MRTLLRTGVSAIALSLATSGAAWAADETFTADQDASARVTGATSTQIGTTNLNDISGNTGETFTGIMSMLQNNGANSVVNNGNAVSAIINTGNTSSDESFTTGTGTDGATQTAWVTDSTSEETTVDDDNKINTDAFRDATGVVSVAQNNGSNAAINNGNIVTGLVESGNSSGQRVFQVRARNDAIVLGDGSASSVGQGGGASASTNDNIVTDDAFESFSGIASVAQNNGANAAINNGNAVAGIVEMGTVTPGGGANGGPELTFNVILQQTASVAGSRQNTEADVGDSGADPAGNIDVNTITEDAFREAKGIVSVAQNNGANSAINNGNGVAGIVTSDQNVTVDDVELNNIGIENAQIAAVGGGNALITDPLPGNDDSANNNLVDMQAFQDFNGVASVVQNNGPNSSINNGNSVAAIVLDDANITTDSNVLDSDSSQSATVVAGGGEISASANLSQTDDNTLNGGAFQTFSGVSSTVQNNGSNAAVNNGNMVAAFIGEENTANTQDSLSRLKADDNSQFAAVRPGPGGLVSNFELSDSDDANLIGGSSFSSAEGIHSVAQNNGANAAINNGNSVAAIIVDSAISNGDAILDVAQSQVARVFANGGTVSNFEDEVDDINTASGTTFDSADGVASMFQNNGANSAINNGNAVAVLLSDDTTVNVDASTLDGGVPLPGGPAVSQIAEVNASSDVTSEQIVGSDDLNTITDQAFRNSEGVFSVGQNNGANSAINNGNTVAAAIADEGSVDASEGVDFDVDAEQTATVGTTGTVESTESVNSQDENTINTDAFQNAAGVFSVLQNNGPNSAINNGNTVAAIIGDCPQCTGANSFNVSSTSTGTVGAFAIATNTNVNNTNLISGQAFQNGRGVFAVTQNNGANAALSNGNVVAAIIQ